MSRRRKLILGAVLLFVVLMLGTVGLGAATVVGRGMIQVRIDSAGHDGDRFGLAIPAVLIDAAMVLAPLDVVKDELPVEEIRPYLPLLDELSSQIERLPDAVFVEVDGPDETVRIEKKNGRFVIDVVGPGDRVHLSVPASTVGHAVRVLQRLV